MNRIGTVLVVLALVAAALVCWLWIAQPSPSDVSPSANPTGSGSEGEVGSTDDEGTVTAIETDPYREQSDAEGGEPKARPAPRRGRVIDVHGKGVPDVALGLSTGGDRIAVSSGADGGFEFVAGYDAGRIVSRDRRWATVFSGSTRLQADRQSTVVVAPRIELAGRVVDSEGQPVPEARVSVHLPPSLPVQLGELMEGTLNWSRDAVCDAEGRFALKDVPAVASAELSATLGGYVPRYVALPESSTVLLELVLDRPSDGAALITGIVVDPFDAPVPGARVSAGGAISRTDHGGEFIIDVSDGRTLDRIVAIAKGMQPAVRLPESDAEGKPKWPERVTLQLGAAPLSITGKVVDRHGDPIEGVRVWVNDPLVIGMEDGAMIAETFLGREDRPFWAFVLTDASGGFRLHGLLDRPYTLKALDPKSLAAVTRKDVRSGRRDVALRMTVDTYRTLHGRVVDLDGVGVANASVRLTRPAFAVRIPGHPNASQFESAWSPPIETDEDGAFTLEDVPTEGVQIQASADTIQTNWKSVGPGIDPKAVTVRVERKRRFKVELAAPTNRADMFKVLKASGRHMLIRSRGTYRVEWPLEDGRTEILSVGNGAQVAVFFKDGVEVGRVPVQLRVGQVTTVRF